MSEEAYILYDAEQDQLYIAEVLAPKFILLTDDGIGWRLKKLQEIKSYVKIDVWPKNEGA